MKKTSVTLAAALAALATGAVAAESNMSAPDAANQAPRKEMQRQQMRKQEQKRQQLHQQSGNTQKKAKQIQMNKERAVKKRMGPGPVA